MRERDVFLMVAQMEPLFDALQDVLFCAKDTMRRYVAANEAFLLAARVRHRKHLLGKSAAEVFPELLAVGYQQQDDMVLQQGVAVRDRLEMITRADGGVGWFLTQKTPLRTESGEIVGLASISRDLDQVVATDAEGAMGFLVKAIDTLHHQCSEPLRIEDMAKESGLSWSQFCRRIQAITGLTPRRLLTKARVEKAAHLLRDGRMTLNDIALECGFYDQAAFNRQFVSLTGLTPGEYRRASRG